MSRFTDSDKAYRRRLRGITSQPLDPVDVAWEAQRADLQEDMARDTREVLRTLDGRHGREAAPGDTLVPKEDFFAWYARNAGLSTTDLEDLGLEVHDCDCGAAECGGWGIADSGGIWLDNLPAKDEFGEAGMVWLDGKTRVAIEGGTIIEGEVSPNSVVLGKDGIEATEEELKAHGVVLLTLGPKP